MKYWIGKSIALIGFIHSIFGLVVFRSVAAQIFNEGIINTINNEPMKNLAFWFIYFGFFVIVFGFLIDWCEKNQFGLPKFLGWSLLALTILIVAIMPISGGWLLFAPSIGAILHSRRLIAK